MIPGEISKAEVFVQQQAWAYRISDDQIILEYCPLTACDNFHFYMKRGGEKDGLWDCKKCGKSGNLYTLKEALGIKDVGVASMQEMAGATKKPDPLPDVNICQQRLLADEEVCSYLFDERGFSPETVKRQMLGLAVSNGQKILVIPYIYNGRCVYAKYRTIPPAEKKFFNSKGRDNPLYNEQVIVEGMEELIFVEGEMDCIAMLNKGINNVVGVPGANNKKAIWITKIDKAAPKRMYILYDSDKVGQEAAEEMAKRIGIEKVFNILLPEFETVDGKRGKDINEWFQAGHTLEEFNVLKQQAVPFEVRGVTSVIDVLDQMEKELEGKELLQPTYVTPWDDLNRKIGGFERGDVVDIIAVGKIGKTTFGMNLIDYLSAKYEEPGLIYCLEMPEARLVRKLVSMLTQTDDSPAKDEAEARKRLEMMKVAIPMAKEIILGRKADLLFSSKPVRHEDEAFELMYQAVRRYGVRFAMLDNMQFLCDATLRNNGQRTVHMSQISKRSKNMANELGLVLFRIVQPKKLFKDQIVSHEDADGSSQLSKDCDATVALHRTQRATVNAQQFEAMGFLDEEIALAPQLYARVSISRYAPGGVCTLMFEGATSTVRELTEQERAGVQAPPSSGGLPKESYQVQA